jgi:ParB family chromosome partitioning protein
MPDSKVPYIIKDIPLSDIIFPPEEMRSGVTFEGMDELAMSIRKHGLIQPITVRPSGDKYELIAGYRRTKACEMNGMLTVMARVIESSDELALLQKAAENLFREEVNAFDEGGYLKLILEKNNWKIQDLASAINKSEGYVSRRIKLQSCFEDVKDALKDGRINLSIAEELARVTDTATRLRILSLVINNGATVDVVRSWRVQYEMQKNVDGPKWDPATGLTEGQAGNDPTKPGNLVDDHGPQMALNESVDIFRICHSCLVKVPEKEAKLLIMCPECCKAIEPYLGGNASKPKIQ